MSGEHQKNTMNAVLSRAAIDWEFRQQLIADPRGALARSFGVAIPPELKLRFIERDADLDALVVLPVFKGTDWDGELSDDLLETVNGGTAGPVVSGHEHSYDDYERKEP